MMSIVSPETGEGEPGETMSFKNKRSFFEQEILNLSQGTSKTGEVSRKFSYLQEHEVNKLKTEDEKRSTGLTTEDLLKNVRESMGALGINHETQITNLSKTTQAIEITNRESNVKGEIEKLKEPTEEQLIMQRRNEAFRRARRQSLEEDERRAQVIYNRSQKLRDQYYQHPLTPQHSPTQYRNHRIVGRSSSFNRSSTIPRNNLMTSSMIDGYSSLRRGSATLPRQPYHDDT